MPQSRDHESLLLSHFAQRTRLETCILLAALLNPLKAAMRRAFCRIALGNAMGFYVSFGWLGQHCIGGRSVVARFLFTLALENPSCGQQSFESGIIEGGALAHTEIASTERMAQLEKRPSGFPPESFIRQDLFVAFTPSITIG
jgi:hypothetical protein